MATAIRIVITAPIISIPKNFHMNLIQFDHSIFAIAREPITPTTNTAAQMISRFRSGL